MTWMPGGGAVSPHHWATWEVLGVLFSRELEKAPTGEAWAGVGCEGVGHTQDF